MRLPFFLATGVFLLQIISDIYLFYLAKRRSRRLFPQKFQLWETIFFLVYMLVFLLLPKCDNADGLLRVQMWMLFGYFTVYLPKILFIIFDLLASLPILFHRKRIRWVTTAGVVAAATLFGGMWWGALINRNRIQVNEVEIEIDRLPESFDGYRIAQLSDLHVGTFGTDTTFISRLTDRVNSLHPDLIVFTGDIVNRHSGELTPFVKPLSRLSAKDGVISILGNHDYGDYFNFPTPYHKEQNMEWLMDLQIEMGWELLTNSTSFIYGDTPGDSIAIVGVENWGDPPFPTHGNLTEAYPTPGDSVVKILLTHNPAHWIAEIAPADSMKMDLTLSGHTHAMQMEIMGASPAVWRYSTWAGRYDSADGRRPLYVNIGAGTVGIPMRLGATPEITIITLKSRHK